MHLPLLALRLKSPGCPGSATFCGMERSLFAALLFPNLLLVLVIPALSLRHLLLAVQPRSWRWDCIRQYLTAGLIRRDFPHSIMDLQRIFPDNEAAAHWISYGRTAGFRAVLAGRRVIMLMYFPLLNSFYGCHSGGSQQRANLSTSRAAILRVSGVRRFFGRSTLFLRINSLVCYVIIGGQRSSSVRRLWQKCRRSFTAWLLQLATAAPGY